MPNCKPVYEPPTPGAVIIPTYQTTFIGLEDFSIHFLDWGDKTITCQAKYIKKKWAKLRTRVAQEERQTGFFSIFYIATEDVESRLERVDVSHRLIHTAYSLLSRI
ncbi:uncharacterized protein MCYG_02165 [Microsporum canis CBS 113480]|uniref:Uncharacterized protein n=1 Tax=Arthroderma otae (strain ATCC MYA-4605 / CBS 113480) TaxID=554155 RepID=C5FJ16_ARTOC|nr:uncharacterized protein MCYG_02165 [Microsporum canis CBS 113480]EEQ29346.1 predicted protein [Microsporum canis CBS 113480]